MTVEASRHRVATAMLLIPLCLALFLPGVFSLPPIDRDEPRFAQASRQMWQSGDYIDVRFQDEPRHRKPIGIYWLQSAVVAVAGAPRDGEIWPYRVPSLVGATLAVLFTAWIGGELFGRRAGRLAGVMLATCLLLNVEARLATTDAALLAAVVAAQGALARIYLRHERSAPSAWVLWISIAVALLLKGPVVLAVCGGTIAFLLLFDNERSWARRLRPLLGLVVVLGAIGPWLIAITFRTAGEFPETFATDSIARIFSAKESHGGPPGYHAIAFLIAFWPFSLLSVLTAKRVWGTRAEKAVRFCLAWILPFWTLCEIMGTKLPHYVLPAYPAIASLTAHAVVDGAQEFESGSSTRFQRWVVGAWLVCSVALGAALFMLPVLANGRLDGIGSLSAVAIIALSGATACLLRRGRIVPGIASATGAAMVLSTLAFGEILPRLESVWLSQRVATVVAGLDGCDARVVASADFHEPSLVFLLGKETKLVGPEGAAEHLLQNPSCALALVSGEQSARFATALQAAGAASIELERFEGFNYSKGRTVTLTLYELDRSRLASSCSRALQRFSSSRNRRRSSGRWPIKG